MNKNVRFVEDYLELRSHPVRGTHSMVDGVPYITYHGRGSTIEEAMASACRSLPLRTDFKSEVICWRIYPRINFYEGSVFFIHFRMLVCSKTSPNISHPPHKDGNTKKGVDLLPPLNLKL